MKEKLKISQLKISLMGVCTGAIMFGLTGSVLAQDDKAGYEEYQKNKAGYEEYQKKQADKKQQPHLRPPPSKAPANAKAGNLAEAATNPIAPMVQFQLQDTYNWENHNSDGYSNVTVVQAVAPIPLPWKAVPMMITRSTLPWVTTPEIADPVGRHRGFGDFEMLLLATPKLETKGVQLGFGLNTSWPTAGDNDFTGSGKYEAGPSALYINMKTPKLQWGLFAYQLWDYASSSGDSDRPGVSELSLQPFITKHFSGGWFVGSPDTPQTYNFKSDKWTWALGGQVGRVTKLGKLPIKWFGEVLYNPEDNNGPTAEWTAKVGLTFLFPE